MQKFYPHVPPVVKRFPHSLELVRSVNTSTPYWASADALIDQSIKERADYVSFISSAFPRSGSGVGSPLGGTARGADRERLGNSAKSEAASDFFEVFQRDNKSVQVDFSTGEILETEQIGRRRLVVSDLDKARSERFELQTVAGRLLPRSRTSKCLKFEHKRSSNSAASGSGIRVLKSDVHGTSHYEGLQTCASVWACPVCAAKISERRTVEVKTAISNHMAAGGRVLMVTYTFPHSRTDDLKDLIGCLSTALRKLKAHRRYKSLTAQVAQVGTIRALEVTHGSNGWHPHIHELWLVDRPPFDLEGFSADLFGVWAGACRSSDLPVPSAAHGVDVRLCSDADIAAAYVAKEMTKSHSKRGRSGNYTAFDLLRAVADGDMTKAPLFREYAESFKGARQLVWSRGLKALFLIEELSDEEIFALKDEESVEVGTIDRATWRVVCRHERRYPKSSPRAVILSLVQSQGWPAVQVYLSRLILDDVAVLSSRRLSNPR